MSDLKSEMGRFNSEFSKLQDMFQQALDLLKGEPDFAIAKDMKDSVTAKHAEWLQAIGPATDWLEKEEKELKQGLAAAKSRIVDVEGQLKEALAEAEKPAPRRQPAPPPLVPGEGDPGYGLALGAELLTLIGIGSATADGAGQAKHGDVWQLESVDWKVDSTALEQQPPRSSSPPPGPAQPPPGKAPPDRDKSIGQSIDWTD